MADLPVKSVTIAEVIDDEGQRVIEITTDGDPSTSDVLGMLAYATEIQKLGMAGDDRV